MIYLVTHLLAIGLRDNADKEIIVYKNYALSYSTFIANIIHYQKQLANIGIQKNDKVSICVEDKCLLVMLLFSLMLIGAIPCVVEFGISIENLSEINNKISANFCLSENSDVEYSNTKHIFMSLPSESIDINCSVNAMLIHLDQCVSNCVESDIALVLFTSGSTGDRKGILLSHRNIIAALLSIQDYLNITSADKIINFLPLHFDYGLYQIFLSLLCGAPIVFSRERFSINEFYSLVDQFKPTILPVVPSFIVLLDKATRGKSINKNLCLLRIVTNTGERLTHHLIKTMKKTFRNALIYSMYGLTECKRCSFVPPHMLEEKYESIGLPMKNIRMWIADDDGQSLPPGEIGNIYVEGPTIMRGYINQPQGVKSNLYKTDFRSHVLNTGDKGYMDDDGYFYHVGRSDGVLKYNGEKLFIFDIMNTIDSLDYVSRSYVFLKNFKNNMELFVSILCTIDKLSPFHYQSILKIFPARQKPSFIYPVSAFPVTSNGKINYKQLESATLNAYDKKLNVS